MLEARLIALRSHQPELRVESRTVHIATPVSAWTDELRPHSLLIASFVPEMVGSMGTTVIVATHNRDLIERFGHSVMSLSEGYLYPGLLDPAGAP